MKRRREEPSFVLPISSREISVLSAVTMKVESSDHAPGWG